MRPLRLGVFVCLLGVGTALGWALHAHVAGSAAPLPAVPAPEPVVATPLPAAPQQFAADPEPDAERVREAWAAVTAGRGARARLVVPDELRHYADDRRFLALQMADAQQGRLEVPHDVAALCQMILRGELVEVPTISDNLVLYEIGEDAREDPLAHWDAQAKRDVPLLATEDDWARELVGLQHEEEAGGKRAVRARAWRELLERHYGDPDRRREMFAEHAAVTRLASDFGGVGYDLSDGQQRRRFSRRLLRFVRPSARAVIDELAGAYHERFARRLPVTSLIRTERYQWRLSRVNSNATMVDIPPHGTGVAFDVSYSHMDNDEQNLVMALLARMEAEGRVETLRERRGHLHVYTFADGRRPEEALVASLLAAVEAARLRPRGSRMAETAPGEESSRSRRARTRGASAAS